IIKNNKDIIYEEKSDELSTSRHSDSLSSSYINNNNESLEYLQILALTYKEIKFMLNEIRPKLTEFFNNSSKPSLNDTDTSSTPVNKDNDSNDENNNVSNTINNNNKQIWLDESVL